MLAPTTARPRVGVSSCLVGERVRYDGGHKRVDWIVRELARRVELVPVCPELEAGLGVPRAPMRLERRHGPLGVYRIEDHGDVTPALLGWARGRIEELSALDLDGYVFKSGSPSCGLRDVPVIDGDGRPVGRADGLFARAVRDRWPDLPVADERELATEDGRTRFEAAVFACARARGRRRRR